MKESSQNILYNWKYEDVKNRSPIWYVIALSIAIWLIVWGFLTRQYGMSIVIMMLSWFFFFLENNADENIEVILTDLWIKVQNNFYDYAKISWFHIVYDWENAVYLRLGINKRSLRTLSIRVDNTIAADLRSILSNFVEENEKQEITFGEKILHLLKI